MLAATAANAAAGYHRPPPQPICVPRDAGHLWPGVPICARNSAAGICAAISASPIRESKAGQRAVSMRRRPCRSSIPTSTARGLFGLGVGYQFNNWLRVDVTGEYRGRLRLPRPRHHFGNGSSRPTITAAKKSEWLFLANAYVDLGTWWCVTPFVGAGIGASRINISGFTRRRTRPNGRRGLRSRLTSTMEFRLGAACRPRLSRSRTTWRSNWPIATSILGDGRAGDIRRLPTATTTINNPITFNDITSHDVKLGLRWICCDSCRPPVVRRRSSARAEHRRRSGD